MACVKRLCAGVLGIDDQGVTPHRALGIETALYRQAQENRTDHLAMPAQIAGQAPHPETGHRVGGEVALVSWTGR